MGPRLPDGETSSLAIKVNLQSHLSPEGKDEQDLSPFSSASSTSRTDDIKSAAVSNVLRLRGLVPLHIKKRVSAYKRPSVKQALWSLFSMIEWPYFPWATANFKKYPEFIYDDLLAGIVVGIMVVPQGMSYAMLAPLPPIQGLYCSTLSGYVYAFLGSSGQMTIGPVILVSTFMTDAFRGLGLSLSKKDPTAVFLRQEAAAVLALAVGIQLIVLAALGLGRVIKFISPSMMVGFTTGAGFYIGLSQSKSLFGVQLPETKYYYQAYLELFRAASAKTDPMAATIGWGSFFFMLFFWLLKKAVKPTPQRRKKLWYKLFMLGVSSTTLVLMIVVTIIARRLIKEGHKVVVIGQIPSGFNPFRVPAVGMYGLSFGSVMVRAVPLMILCLMESYAMAQKYAVVNHYQVDANQEMWALGVSSIVASFFSAYTPGGSFGRTALKAELGAKTPVGNIYTALLVTFVLTNLTGLLSFVPRALLGAVVMVAILNLLDFGEMWAAMWVNTTDFVVMVFTFIVTAFLNTEMGLEYGILLSIVLLLWQLSTMHISPLGRLSGQERTNTVFVDLTKFPHAKVHRKIRAVRLTASLFFGNIGAFTHEFIAYLEAPCNEHVKVVIVDVGGVSNMDLTTLAQFDEVVQQSRKRGIRVLFSDVSPRLLSLLEGYGLLDDLGGEEQVTRSLEDVHHAALQLLLGGGGGSDGALTEGEEGGASSLAVVEEGRGFFRDD